MKRETDELYHSSLMNDTDEENMIILNRSGVAAQRNQNKLRTNKLLITSIESENTYSKHENDSRNLQFNMPKTKIKSKEGYTGRHMHKIN